MQVRITPENEKLSLEYVELCKKVLTTYSISDTELVNLMLADKLREEIQRLKKRMKV